VSRLSSELDQVRRSIQEAQADQTRLVEHLKNLEVETNQQPDPKLRREMEARLKDLRVNLEDLTVTNQQRRTRESELAIQLQTEQARWNEVNDALIRLERSLSTPSSP
jgi:oligoendopeptidase F